MTKWVTVAMVASLVFTSPADAQKKRKKRKAPPVDGEVQRKEDRIPPPGDKGANEGAQGRKNATEDAAKGADSPSFERRP